MTRSTGGSSAASLRLLAAVTVLPTLAACASAPAAEKTIEPPRRRTRRSSCRATRSRPNRPGRVPVHVGEQWWAFRGDYLKVSEDKARERDGDISEKQAPRGFWDLQTSVETISIWTTFCNECHGGRRKMEDVVRMPCRRHWGRGEGLFFGIRRPYVDIFRTVYNGKIEKEGNRWKMPAWRGKLSKEQIWALIYFVEYQSGGIEGRFRPASIRGKTRNTSKAAVGGNDRDSGSGNHCVTQWYRHSGASIIRRANARDLFARRGNKHGQRRWYRVDADQPVPRASRG